MKESILHYIWQNKLYALQELKTTLGETIQVLNPGKLNTDAGPDFFNAKIKIDDTLWAGNVEIHSMASDWIKHGHQNNIAYDSVILHVVGKADEQIRRTDGEMIPQMELECPPHIAKNYEQLMSEQKWIACADKISQVPSIFIQSWKSNLLTERLQQKMQAIESYLEITNQHWEEAFYITLARNFGFGKNTDAFEKLAKSLPLSILGKHKDNLFQLEALLFGQSGLLDVAFGEYPEKLRKEYTFLKNKYELSALQPVEWKLLRLRPDNFPHVRIAQFAALVHSSSKLFSKIIEQPESEKLKTLLTCEPSEYWATHYLFGDESKPKSKKLGTESINSILINTIVPSIFCYAGRKGQEGLKEKALQILESLPAEKNAIIEGWKILGLDADNAFDSQALLQLKKNYCEEKNCLRCRIGHKVLSSQNG